jgi:tetratricopeptide (TPR) repeat protein
LVAANLKENPHSFDDQRARAVLLTMKPKRRDEGIHALETLDKSRLLSRGDRFLLADLYRGKGEWPRCRNRMLDLLKERNRDRNHLATFVSWLIDQNDLEQADRWLQEYKPTESSQSLVLLELKSRLLKARDRSADLFALLRSHSEQNPDQLGDVGVLCERYGLIKEAEQAYRAFGAQDAKEPTRIFPLIGFLSRQHRDQEALALCEQAWKTCPPEPSAAASVAVVLDGKKLTNEQRHRVVAWLEDLVRRQSSSTKLRLNLATLRGTERRYDQAESLYREVLGESPNNLEALNNLAWLLAFRPGKEQEALDLIGRAIEIAGSDATLLDTRAVVYIQSGKPDPALESLRDAMATDPQKAVAYFHLARAYQLANNQLGARKALERAEALGFKPESVDPLEQSVVANLRQEPSSLVRARATGRAQ